MEYQTERIQTYQTGKPVTDQFYMDHDYNVPDAKEDVREVILGAGSLMPEDVRVVENYVKITGKLKFRVLYVTDAAERTVSSLEGRIPFEEMVCLEQETIGNLAVAPVNVDVTATVIHSRKLQIRAVCDIAVHTEEAVETEITTDLTEDKDAGEAPLYKRYEERELLSAFASKRDIFRIRKEAALEGTKENIETLLWTEVNLRKFDTRLEEDGIRLQGELKLFALYDAGEGKTDWVERTLPFEGRTECQGAEETMYHQIFPELAEVSVEPRMDEDGEMRVLSVEAALEIRFVVYREIKVSVLEDLYCLQKTCVPEIREEQAEQLLMQNHSKCKVSEQLSLPEIKDNILQICHSSARIQTESVRATDEGLQIEGVLHVSFLYIKADDQIPFDTWQGMIPFSYTLESNETTEDMDYGLTEGVEQLSVNLLGSDEIEVRAVLAFYCFFKRPVTVPNIESVAFQPVQAEELEARPGIVGYIVRSGDRLWDLAKRYQTTEESIREVNKQENGEIKTGDKILIFKENMSIL